MFPSKVPKPTYEFPALTICPTHPSATVHIAGCYILTTASKTTCDPVGVFYRTYTYEGTMLNCTSVNEFPGKPGVAGSSDDVLQVSATLSGTSNGSPDGVLVATHPQLEGKEEPRIDYENFFAASTLTMTEVVGKKIYTIDRLGNVITDYEIKASTIRLKMNATAFEESNAPFVIEFRYPRLEITYQKSFLVLDMNNWLGEVGGVAALLFFLLRAFMWIVRTLLQKSDSFAYTDLGKGLNVFKKSSPNTVILFEHDQVLATGPTMKPGVSEFPFVFPLLRQNGTVEDGLPSSYEDKYVAIAYLIRADLVRAWPAKDLDHTVRLRVCDRVDTVNPKYHEPQSLTRTLTLSFLGLVDQGSITGHASIPKRAYTKGETIPIRIQLNHHGQAKNVNAIQASLIKHLSYNLKQHPLQVFALTAEIPVKQEKAVVLKSLEPIHISPGELNVDVTFNFYLNPTGQDANFRQPLESDPAFDVSDRFPFTTTTAAGFVYISYELEVRLLIGTKGGKGAAPAGEENSEGAENSGTQAAVAKGDVLAAKLVDGVLTGGNKSLVFNFPIVIGTIGSINGLAAPDRNVIVRRSTSSLSGGTAPEAPRAAPHAGGMLAESVSRGVPPAPRRPSNFVDRLWNDMDRSLNDVSRGLEDSFRSVLGTSSSAQRMPSQSAYATSTPGLVHHMAPAPVGFVPASAAPVGPAPVRPVPSSPALDDLEPEAPPLPPRRDAAPKFIHQQQPAHLIHTTSYPQPHHASHIGPSRHASSPEHLGQASTSATIRPHIIPSVNASSSPPSAPTLLEAQTMLSPNGDASALPDHLRFSERQVAPQVQERIMPAPAVSENAGGSSAETAPDDDAPPPYTETDQHSPI
ncbi:hypothetical protein HK104_007568 [Borealophlyctis nickersoniae]|nr:hypothetical protein HK104_007568 [Borealophlyctis nickersoniae]